ncbi:MAG: helix-turn-helix domain-containing protein [Ralstonia pickettii]|nr:helix-turn-helix domain-containing protein [Ralstonia pickettii]
MFGERLKLARNRAGLSLRDLAEAIGHTVSAQAIGRYERGEMLPGSDTALKLAKALEVSLSYLFSPVEIRLEGVEFRKTATTRAQERAMVEAAVIDHLDRYLLIEDILEIGSHEWDRPAGAPFKVTNLDDAEEAADAVRRGWNLGGDAIPDLTELLEEHGIKVLRLDFPLSVDGLTCEVARPEKEKVPVIVASSAKSVERRRFTLAHELGHMLMQIGDGLDEEKACHRFASSLLMPKGDLLFEVGQRRHAFGYAELIQVKRMYGVSAAALMVRLRDLGVISEGTLQGVFRGIGRTWRRAEPEPLPEGEEPRRFQRLVLRALAEDAISLPKAAELLRKATSEVDRIMSGPAE